MTLTTEVMIMMSWTEILTLIMRSKLSSKASHLKS